MSTLSLVPGSTDTLGGRRALHAADGAARVGLCGHQRRRRDRRHQRLLSRPRPAGDRQPIASGLYPVSVHEDPREAYHAERDRLGGGRMLVLTGSAYMIDQALNPNPYVRHANASFGWRGKLGDRV